MADLERIRPMHVHRIEQRKGKAAIRLSVDGTSTFVKVYWSKSLLQKLKDGARRVTLAVREARNIQLIAACGVDTAELLAYGYSSSWWVPSHSYLVLKEITQAETLWEYVRRTGDTGVVVETAKLIWKIHRCGLVHRDLHSKNILLKTVGSNLHLVVIDTLGVRQDYSQLERTVELGRFLRKHGRVWLSEETVDRFRRHYYQLGGEPIRRYKDYDEFKYILDKELSKYKPYQEV
ncbi:MAG: hypothetical protein LJE91_15300 [Gammaproteobacteria bacterium]|jgi:tRNA A-37 threonylcarbamoyl transferase component Bud32|nr:hypothetical protein [Gammaproteobacteria bacterium]